MPPRAVRGGVPFPRSRPVDSLSITALDCTSLDLALNLCVQDGDLAGLRAPVPPIGWIPYRVSARAWLHRAAHAGAPEALRLGDRLDLRAADAVACARCSQPLVLRDAAALAESGGPQPDLLWALLTDPRRYVRHLGLALGKCWVLAACSGSFAKQSSHAET